MINGIPSDIRQLIKTKVRLVCEFSNLFVSYMLGFDKSTFAKKKEEIINLALNVINVQDLTAIHIVKLYEWFLTIIKIKSNSIKMA